MDDLLKLLMGTANISPSYHQHRCLAVLQSKTACSRCLEICPHQAITIHRAVEIDEVDCSGCGLCVQVCPSEALEPSVSYASGQDVRCSRVAGEAQSVHCLGRLQPSDLLRLAGGRREVVLAHGDCDDCPIGTPMVIAAVETVAAKAAELAQVHGRALTVEIREAERFDERGRSRQLSRRELLRGGWRSARQGAAAALAPLDPGEPDGDESLPAEMQRRYRVLELAELAGGTEVPWPLPRIADGCILCPVCTNVCPTGAFGRNYRREDGAGPALELDPRHCLDCGACVTACPVKVITMDERVAWGELSGGREVAYRRTPNDGPSGTVAR
jgi:ferredoxin